MSDKERAHAELRQLNDQIYSLLKVRARIEFELNTLRQQRLDVERVIWPGISDDRPGGGAHQGGA